MTVYKLTLVAILFVGFVLCCSKDDQDPMTDWGKKGQRTPAPRPGYVLVDPPASGQVLVNDNDSMKDWGKKGQRKSAPRPGHVLVK